MKKLLILKGKASGRITYEEFYDEAIEQYQCFLSFQKNLDPREIWDWIAQGMATGLLSFEAIREQYGKRIKKEVKI